MKPQPFDLALAKRIWILFWIVGSLWIGTASVDAHRVNIFARVEGDTVHVESKFSGGRRVHTGKITVSDTAGTELLRGTTDENGQFSFKVPQKTDLKIVLEAGTGHRAEWTIPAAEFALSAAAEKPVRKKESKVKNVIIGMGFIFGLTAIIAYIRNRRKKQ